MGELDREDAAAVNGEKEKLDPKPLSENLVGVAIMDSCFGMLVVICSCSRCLKNRDVYKMKGKFNLRTADWNVQNPAWFASATKTWSCLAYLSLRR